MIPMPIYTITMQRAIGTGISSPSSGEVSRPDAPREQLGKDSGKLDDPSDQIKSPLADSGTPKPKTRDYWMPETPTHWIRAHVVPRRACFTPGDTLEDIGTGPKSEDLDDVRVTEQVFVMSGKRATVRHDWTNKHDAHAKASRENWTGRSIFSKKNVPPLTASQNPDTASVPGTGTPLIPDSPQGLRAGLAGLRGKLRIAQEKDPRLSPIIAALRKQPKGTYIAEPASQESFKVQARAQQYRLASDGALVAKEERSTLGSTLDKPVIPNIVFDAPGAPTKMTWKHFILGSMHNTTTGAHRRAEEMHDERKQLVSWGPPGKLVKGMQGMAPEV